MYHNLPGSSCRPYRCWCGAAMSTIRCKRKRLIYLKSWTSTWWHATMSPMYEWAIWGLAGDRVKGIQTWVYIVLMSENSWEHVGELLYGKNVTYEGLTRLPTEDLLSVSQDLGHWIRLCYQILVAVVECTESLDYGPKEFDISQEAAKLCEKRKEVGRAAWHPLVLIWDEENQEECQLRAGWIWSVNREMVLIWINSNHCTSNFCGYMEKRIQWMCQHY